MRVRFGVGIAVGVVLALSSLAHAFLGWPPLRSELEAGGIDAKLIGALAAGWYFGSVAMLAFGVLLLRAALQVKKGNRAAAGPAKVVAVAYVAFGLAAFLARDYNPHFLFFVATGVLVGVFAFWRR